MHGYSQKRNFIKRLGFEPAAPGDVLSRSRRTTAGMKVISPGYIPLWSFFTRFISAILYIIPSLLLTSVPSTR
jgi:hypothetical protein